MEDFVLFYVDDLLIYSEMADGISEILRIRTQTKNCQNGIFQQEIKYLGHLISSEGTFSSA